MKILNILRITLSGITVSLLIPVMAIADVCEKTPSVNINAVSSEEVDNDMVRLVWQVQTQAASANEAMNIVNTALERSINNLSKNKDISKLKNNIQTFPQYGKDSNIQNWQGIGSLTFEMPVQALKTQKNINVAEGMTLNNIVYFPSEIRINQSREKLLQLAIKEFQIKANAITKGFGKVGYKLGNISINDEDQGSQNFPRMYASSAGDLMKKSVEVATASGSSKLSVSINGQVCLKP
jgi:uncharacterized protein YggE